MNCEHSKTHFAGVFSLLGGYICDDCGFRIDPVIEHCRKRLPHFLFSKERRAELLIYLNKLPKEQLELLNLC